ALGREDGLAALVDRVRDGTEARPADVKELARHVGAAQLVALRTGREGMLDARLFDVARGTWVKPAAELEAPSPGASLDAAALLAYLAPVTAGAAIAPAPATAGATGGTKQAKPAEPVPAYKRWYTWVIGGVL